MAAMGTPAADSDAMKDRRRTTTKTKRASGPKVSGRRKPSSTNADTKIALLKRERDEALEQQKATAEVLRVVSASPGDLKPAFAVILENATRLCQANFGVLFLSEGDAYRAVAMHNAPSAYVEARRREPLVSMTGTTVIAEVARTKRTVQTADMAKNPAYRKNPQYTQLFVRLTGARSFVGVPMLKDDALIGVIGIFRQEVRSFTDKQIELVENFAAQAVIAIENTRLLNELRQSLEQQTATAEVLSVISSSPGELQPVFQAMLENAVRICEARFGSLFRFDGEKIQFVAEVGTPPKYAEFQKRRGLVQARPGTLLDRAARTKQVIHTADYAAEPFPGNAATLGGARSTLCVPMLREDALIGAIYIYRTEVRPFTDKQIELVKNFAAQAVIAIENTRLLNELRELLQQQTATADVLKVISHATFDLQVVLDTLVELAARLCEAYDLGMLLRQGDRLLVRAHYGPIPLDSGNWPIDRGLVTGRAFLDRVPVHVHDLQASADEFPIGSSMAHDLGHRTMFAVPLMRNDEAIGVLMIRRNEIKPFTDKQIELVTTFADQAVIAIENVRLFEAEQQRTAELAESLEQQTATSEVLSVISSSPGDLEPVFQAMLANATRICEAKFGALFLWDGEGLHLAAEVGTPPEYAQFHRKRGPFKPIPGSQGDRVLRSKQVIHTSDYAAEAPSSPAVMLGGARSTITVPMLKDEELIGTIHMYRQEVRPFTDKQIALVQNFAAQAVIAIENTRLLNELRQRTDDLSESLEQQTATSKVLEVISRSAFDLHAVFETVAESSVRLCGADRAFIFRFDGELLRMAVAYNSPPEFTAWVEQHPIRPGRHSGSARAALERRTIHIPDVRVDSEYTYGAKDAEAIRTVLGVPILKGDDLLGVMMIYHLEGVRPFTEKQIALVETFADQAAIAIENARLFEAEQQRTRELSESLEQQTATADVLKVISRSTFELQTVLETLTKSAAQLCNADMAGITRPVDGDFYYATNYNFPTDWLAFVKNTPHKANRGSIVGRSLLDANITHVHDVLADPDYAHLSLQQKSGFRTVLAVPLLREGHPIGVIALARKKVEPFSKRQIELVGTFADQAVIAIENARLFEEIQDKSRQLEVASQHKSQFLANMSHELRTPLNAILGYTELMADGIYGELPEKTMGVLKRLESNGRHLLGLINDVLDLSKIEAGQLVLDLSDYSLEDIAQTVRSTLEPLAADKKLAFKVEVGPKLPAGHGDGRRLTQVLINLVGNAIKFTDAGEVVIKATATDGSFHLSVRDTGPGISAVDQSKLFQEFHQADNAITRKKGGTGLGLAISKRIIEMHGGKIWLESQIGQGSTFAFTVPVRVVRQVEPV